MTKSELVDILRSWGACEPAIQYVLTHGSDDAAIVCGDVPQLGWAIWLMGREFQLDAWVTACIEKARTADHVGGSRDAANGAWLAYQDADDNGPAVAKVAATAAMLAAFAEPDFVVARDQQLDELREIARAWANNR